MPAPVPTSVEVAESICESPGPLLFLDTSVILDILRAPYMNSLQVEIIDSAAWFVDQLATVPRPLWAVSTANVLREFEHNRQTVIAELSAHVRKASVAFARLSQIARIVVPERPAVDVGWLDDAFRPRIVGVMDRLVGSLTLFEGALGCVHRARNRVVDERAPSSKSREYMDCEIFEEFLELALILRDKGFEKPILFVTSNFNDYGRPPGREAIASDLESVGAQFCGDLAWARSKII